MKVAIIGSRGLPPRYGGFEVFAHYLAKKFSQLGYETVVYCASNLKEAKYELPNVKRVFIKSFPLRSLEKIFLSSQATFNAVFRERVDVIIYLGVSAGFVMWLPRLFSIKTILNPDGLEWKRRRWNFFGRALLKTLERVAACLADVIVADSESIGEYIKLSYGREFTFIPYGCFDCQVDETRWQEISLKYGLEKNGYYLVVGRFVPENNYDIIMEGFLRSNTSKKLVFVTNEVPEGALRDERIVFTGPIYNLPILNSLRRNAFAYIHGHSVGGTNPSLLEAISCDSLVIAYDAPFNREVVGEYGFYFKTSEDLKRIIENLETDDPPLVSERLEYYDKIRKEKYNWELVTGKYAEIIERLMKK
ncbi:MAG: DUF1972 domain-containing protein [Candidatus Hydrothermia bacterium]